MSASEPSADRQAFYRRIDGVNLAPLWEVYGKMITPEPTTPCLPYVWHYAQVRQHLLESGGLISTQEAERRVLILENPGLRGQSCVTQSLFAGLQLILPGEIAPAHRHSQSALRLVLEGHHGYTGVDGEHLLMERGDFIITPAWTWHDHGNDTPQPMIWLDGLDIPMTRFFPTSFVERAEQERQPERRPPGDSLSRYGANLRPVAPASPAGAPPAANAVPLTHYPYSRTREALERLRKAEEWDPHQGLMMEFTNPVTGGPAMPTISTFIQLLPRGLRTQTYRSTEGRVLAVLEGQGSTWVGEQRLDWGPNDVLVIPSWQPQRHEAAEDAVLFSYSDRGVQQQLGLWREQRL